MMALVLSMKEGHEIHVGGTKYLIERVISSEKFVVKRMSDGRDFEIDTRKWVEVAPHVSFIAGMGRKSKGSWAKLLIQAAPEYVIGDIQKGD